MFVFPMKKITFKRNLKFLSSHLCKLFVIILYASYKLVNQSRAPLVPLANMFCKLWYTCIFQRLSARCDIDQLAQSLDQSKELFLGFITMSNMSALLWKNWLKSLMKVFE